LPSIESAPCQPSTTDLQSKLVSGVHLRQRFNRLLVDLMRMLSDMDIEIIKTWFALPLRLNSSFDVISELLSRGLIGNEDFHLLEEVMRMLDRHRILERLMEYRVLVRFLSITMLGKASVTYCLFSIAFKGTTDRHSSFQFSFGSL
jgi:hypothetical protein